MCLCSLLKVILNSKGQNSHGYHRYPLHMDLLTCPVAVFSSSECATTKRSTYTFMNFGELQVFNGNSDLYSINNSLGAGKLSHKVCPVFIASYDWASLLPTTEYKTSIPASGTKPQTDRKPLN